MVRLTSEVIQANNRSVLRSNSDLEAQGRKLKFYVLTWYEQEQVYFLLILNSVTVIRGHFSGKGGLRGH